MHATFLVVEIADRFLGQVSVSVSVYCFALSYTKARKKSNYLNSHGKEAQEKLPGL